MTLKEAKETVKVWISLGLYAKEDIDLLSNDELIGFVICEKKRDLDEYVHWKVN